MAATDPESPEAFAREVRNVLLKGFAIPVGVLVFFALAGGWLNHNLRTEIGTEIQQSNSLSAADKAQRTAEFAQINFAEVCGAAPEGLERLRANLEENGVCAQFQRLRWSLWLSLLLVAIMVGVTLSTLALNRRARTSPADLIRSYRTAWRLSVVAALAKIVLLIPLLAYGSFELTTLASGQYYPKLIAVVIIGGLIALWRGIAILVKPVPLEFEMPMTRAVAPAEAPALWADVRAAAAKMGTTPPDHIVVGMQHNFFVTELAVKYRGGRAEGRTLYLSQPLLQQLGPDEVMAIIGHELGHFRGDDTRITREFYPMRFKADATLQAMAGAGWVGWTSVHALLFFRSSFASTEQAMSRERELLADRAAADLTSPAIMGRSLIKMQVFSEAFNRTLTRPGNPFAVPLGPLVRDELVPLKEFWTKLFEHKAEHPLDSHPSLRVRLGALGQPIDPDVAAAVATAPTGMAYDRWFAGRDDLFAGIVEEAMQLVSRVRTATADYATPEGKELLDQQFPEVRWPARASSLWLKISLCSFGVLLFLLMSINVAVGWEMKLAMAVLAALCALPIVQQWRRHHGAEFILRADSLSYTGWHRPLLFADVAKTSAAVSWGTVALTFWLKAPAPRIWKFSPFGKIRSRSVVLQLGLIPGKQKETLQTIHRYVTRQPVK